MFVELRGRTGKKRGGFQGEVGEIHVVAQRSSGIFQQYRSAVEHKTGRLLTAGRNWADSDEGLNLYIVDRKKDMIISGGREHIPQTTSRKSSTGIPA